MTRPTWFAARIILRSVHHDKPRDPKLFEERIVLVHAATEDEARQKAERLGRAAREEYANTDSNAVVWEFMELLDVKQLFLNELEDGCEVYYGFLNAEELDQIRRMVSTPVVPGA